MKPRILVLDIETKPALAYVFGMFKVNIGIEHLEEDGAMICVGAKWLGEKEIFMFSDWEHGHQAMVEAIHALICEADAVITYNGDKFDLPKLTGEFLLAGLSPPPPLTSIDVYKTVRKFGLQSGKLAYVGPKLELGAKVKNEGIRLWISVMKGDARAQKRMEKYCAQDVRLLEKLYKRVLPYIRNHPHLGFVGRSACGACGSVHVQSRGYRRTRAFRIQRIHCTNCGSWQDGVRAKAA